MSAKFFCDFCDKELFTDLSQEKKAELTILEMEQSCICSDCFMEEIYLQYKDEQEFIAAGIEQ